MRKLQSIKKRQLDLQLHDLSCVSNGDEKEIYNSKQLLFYITTADPRKSSTIMTPRSRKKRSVDEHLGPEIYACRLL